MAKGLGLQEKLTSLLAGICQERSSAKVYRCLHQAASYGCRTYLPLASTIWKHQRKGRGSQLLGPLFCQDIMTDLPQHLLQYHGKGEEICGGNELSALQHRMPHFPTFPRTNWLTEELLHLSVSCFFSPRAAPTTSSALPGPTQLLRVLFPQPPPNPQNNWLLK